MLPTKFVKGFGEVKFNERDRCIGGFKIVYFLMSGDYSIHNIPSFHTYLFIMRNNEWKQRFKLERDYLHYELLDHIAECDWLELFLVWNLLLLQY